MFTGIVEEVGVVAKISDIGMTVRATKVTEDLKLGDSIAVNGACLTAVSFDRTEFSVDLSPETMRRTSLDQLSVGGPVNLERALLASDRMGGHIMQGHRSEEHTSELQSRTNLVCRLLLEKKKKK